MANDVDKYIAGFPREVQIRLEEIRAIIQKNAPEAFEKISYAIPTFDLNGNLVHFAGYKNHIGFYPGSDGIAAFKSDIEKYKWAKGSVQFPLDKKIPVTLVSRMVKYRVKQNMEMKTKSKKK